MQENKVIVNRFKVTEQGYLLENDPVVVEEPLQLTLSQGDFEEVYSLTMRTPGDDEYLIAGLLFTEGIITSAAEIKSIGLNQLNNLVTAEISAKVNLDLIEKRRRHASYSGCGLCGKTSLKALELQPLRAQKLVESKLNNQTIKNIKYCLAQQTLFSETGGSHVAGLIYEKNQQLNFNDSIFFEDVGRHNALDKLIGYELITHDLQQTGLLVLSGRIGFELIQKAVMAGFSVVIALGAPSTLAIQAAKQFNLKLIGFAKDHSFNLYTAD